MSDEILCSPVRLIAFHSGKYDFAEVRLDAPLHLMGANNIGKTSLISMLQFLYLNDQRKMHFSHPLNETRKYYFPATYSYILFECRTPEGMAVVGVHGLGPARQYDFERFTYRGRFEIEDYLTDARQIRDADQVKARLAGKNYVKLEPQHLRAALSGVGEDRGVRLGLVPLRDRRQYDRFSFLFCNLLRLAQLRQDELKELLVEIYNNEFQQKEIDLSVEYRDRFSRLQRDAQALKELRWIEKDVANLFTLIDQRDSARGALPILWMELGRLFTARESELENLERDKRLEYERLREQEETLKEERSAASGKRDGLIGKLGELRSKLEDFRRLEESLADFMPDWAERRYDDLRKETANLQAGISRLEGERAEQIDARIKRLEVDLGKAERLRDSGDYLILAGLRKEFEDEDIAELFRILNPSILHLNESDVDLSNPSSVRMRLERLLEKFSDGSYADGDIRIDLREIPPHDISELVNPEVLTLRIDELKRQIRHESDLLEAARDREGLEKKLADKRKEEDRLKYRLIRWSELCGRREQADQWTAEVQSLETESEKLQDKINRINLNIQSLAKEGQSLLAAAQFAEKERRELLERHRRLSPPKEDWEAGTGIEFPDGLDDLFEVYRRTFSEERLFADEADTLLNGIHDRTYGKYNGQTEQETLHRLKEAVDALGSREAALRKSWADFAVSLRSSFSALSHDLERLEGKVGELNRRMGKVTVSNLDNVGLIVCERPEWMKRIKSLCDFHDDLPLFGESDNSSNDMEELGRLLEQTQSVGLRDLFDLHFEIQGSDGRKRTYTNLDQIESNGTTITIKVLVHLILLRDLMSGRRACLPFYLDEVSSLDHDNIAGIIRLAGSLDFIPVLASPDSVEEVRRIYMLAENPEGRIVLDETALIELRQDNESG